MSFFFVFNRKGGTNSRTYGVVGDKIGYYVVIKAVEPGQVFKKMAFYHL